MGYDTGKPPAVGVSPEIVYLQETKPAVQKTPKVKQTHTLPKQKANTSEAQMFKVNAERRALKRRKEDV